MKLTLMVAVSLVALLQADDKTIQSVTAQKALNQFAQQRRKIEERYQTDLDKATERLVRRLETAKKERLKRGDLKDAMRIDAALREASNRPRTPKQLQRELAGTRWNWKTSAGAGALKITFGDGWYQLSDQEGKALFVPSSGNQIVSRKQDNGDPSFDATFTDDLQTFLFRSRGVIRIGSRIK